jgi:2-(1,2-epoxy-1,2-dihydrophenyl)acetyl-CoA isomerase
MVNDIDLSGDGDIALVRICRPPHNFFDADLVAAIADQIESVALTHRVVVLHSEGRNFCAGADLRSAATSGFSRSGTHLYDEGLRLFRQPLPIVAAIQGRAVGGGVGLALAADVRVGTPDTKFDVPFAKIGTHHGFGVSVTLPEAVGAPMAADMLYTGRVVAGEEAARRGLLQRIVPTEHLLDGARAVARTIAEASPAAISSIRSTLRGARIDDLIAAMAHERREQERLADQRLLESR